MLAPDPFRLRHQKDGPRVAISSVRTETCRSRPVPSDAEAGAGIMRVIRSEGVAGVRVRRSRLAIWRCRGGAEGGAAETIEAAVDGFGRSVRGAGPVDVGQDVAGAAV